MNYAYFGHHKCASTWAIHITYEICNTLGFKPNYFRMGLDKNPEQVFYDSSKPTMLMTQTTSYKEVCLLNKNFKGYHIIRDPRDIIVSGYFSHLKTHQIKGWQALANHREELQTISIEEGLLREMDFLSIVMDRLGSWNYNQDNIFETKMEVITRRPFEEWRKILIFMGIYDDKITPTSSFITNYIYDTKAFINRTTKYLDIPHYFRLNKAGINEYALKKIINKFSFRKLSKGRKLGIENVNSHYRKGKPGDWQNYFNRKHKKAFKDQYGQLLIKLGYEKDMNW